MKGNERIKIFLQLQAKNIKFEEIAKEIGINSKTLRRFLNKNGYKIKDGKYKLQNSSDESQTVYKEIKKENIKKPKKDKKINITTEDMDKLCEVYDWYLQVRDFKSLKSKSLKSKKDINIDKVELKNFKSANIKVEKATWDEFERLCSNSQFSKPEILTQALKDFMKVYKNLL